MKQTIGYTRISSNSLEQLHALEQHKARLKAAGCNKIYYDIASRSQSDREGLNTVLGQIERGECREAIFIRVDRMTDSPVVLEKAITICLDAGIPIKGLDDSIDFTTVGGRLHARILCNLARAEVERLSERVKHGHQHHRDRNAAYFPIFGYRKVGDKLELHTSPFLCLLNGKQEMSRAAVGRDIIETFLVVKSLRKTLQEINSKYGLYTHAGTGKGNKQARGKFQFGVSGLTSWLNNPILRGHTAYGRSYRQRMRHQQDWDVRIDTHSGIQLDGSYDKEKDHRLMSEKEYEEVESILKWNADHHGFCPAKTVHPVSGLVYCAECNKLCGLSNYRLRTDPTKITYSYQCTSYRLKACNQKRTVRQSIIETAIIDALLTRSEAIASLAVVSNEQIETPEMQALRAELTYYQAAPGHRAAAIVAELKGQIESLIQQELQTSTRAQTNRELLVQCFGDRMTWEHLMSLEEKRDVYRALVNRVTIRDGQVQSVSLKV
jgi:DNA invertase Pin-like site-specific DNA recombinase